MTWQNWRSTGEREEFEITDEEVAEIQAAMSPRFVSDDPLLSSQMEVNLVWERLGRKYGFHWQSAEPLPKGLRYFTAEPNNNHVLPPA